MTFRIQHDFYFLGKESPGFSKDYFYEWEDGLGGPPSQLFLNFEADEDVNGEEIGNLIFESMKNHFFLDLERQPGHRFEDMLKEINHLIQEKEEECGMPIVPHLNVIAAALTDGQLYLSQRGDSEAYLIRRRYLSLLSEGLSDPKQTHELFSDIAQGALASGDYILLSSARLLRYITKSELAKIFSEDHSLPSMFQLLKETMSLDLNHRVHLVGIHVGDALPVRALQERTSDEEFQETEYEETSRVESKKAFSFPLLASLKGTVKGHLDRFRQSRAQQATREVPGTETPVEPTDGHENVSEAFVDRLRTSSDRFSFFSEWREMKRDKILMVLIVVVLILLLGIYLVRHQGAKQKYIEELESKLNVVQTNVSTAQTKGTYDKDAATTLLDEAYTLSMEVLNSGYLRGKANEYLTQIEQQRDQLDGVNRIENPDVFLDFFAINPNMNATGILAVQDKLYVYDPHQLYEVVLNEIQQPLLIDQEDVIVDGAYFQDNESLLFLTKSNRVVEYDDGQISFLDTEDGVWHSSIDLEVYNNRVYLLDPSQKQIWRYTRQRDGFSGANGYVTDASVDLSQAVSFAIDGAVFVLNEDGTLTKLFSGEREELLISKAPTTDVAGAIEVDAEFERSQVFLLDPSMSRVLVYNKDAKSGNLVYLRQFVFENVEELRDLYFDKKANRLYVLGVTKVYEVSY